MANSKKPGGKCVAGKVTLGQYQNNWIRPVAPRQNRAITLQDQIYLSGQYAGLLDVINISYTGLQPGTFQQENHIIDTSLHWGPAGRFDRLNLHTLVDGPPRLWPDSVDDSYSGLNDRVPGASLVGPISTLYLIQPVNVSIKVSAEGAQWGDQRLRVRAFFTYNRVNYGLMVTDPTYEATYVQAGAGRYQPDDITFFTVSLGEIDSRGFAYKLVAAVF
ncbi:MULTISPECIES: hypothetical protein [unclassified Pseudomonas]|uniref:dual OB domain-containing protein n=1 Tax=unclassified Pseudomonas TaxID=196821 RepID=UPI002AC9A4BC|nr:MULTISPECIES: hypothetical protein [unclassified Pseudomonas]MEB0043335.1 hypothetical protein [Pseudomonas sp. MH10]MEB0121543.1 hypothetical protein [Pseudomonas sp. CCI1.2]WPX64061.1 hypothetical protein RHM59_24965 [Pseudomonas sp. MH10]